MNNCNKWIISIINMNWIEKKIGQKNSSSRYSFGQFQKTLSQFWKNPKYIKKVEKQKK
jgi:hypothetical protein